MASGDIPKAYHSVVARGNQHNISGGHGFVEFKRKPKSVLFLDLSSKDSLYVIVLKCTVEEDEG